jgi:hypothetical protein
MAFVAEAACWASLGDCQEALMALRRGLRFTGVDGALRQMQLVNVASLHDMTGEAHEAAATAESVVTWFREDGRVPAPEEAPTYRRDAGTLALAHWVAGNARLRLAVWHPDEKEHAGLALPHLCEARRIFDDLHRRCKDPNTGGPAKACEGAILLAEVCKGERDTQDALQRLTIVFDTVPTPTSWPNGPQLEAWGWWCVYGAIVSLRCGPSADAEFHRFVDLGLKIGERVSLWAFVDQILSLELMHARQRGVGVRLDDLRLKLAVKAMARVSGFRDADWSLLFSRKGEL